MEPTWTAIVSTFTNLARILKGGWTAICDWRQAAEAAQVKGAADWLPLRLERLDNEDATWVGSIAYTSFASVTIGTVTAVRPKGALVATLNRKTGPLDRGDDAVGLFGRSVPIDRTIKAPQPATAGGRITAGAAYLFVAIRLPQKPWWARSSTTSLELDVEIERTVIDRRGGRVQAVARTSRVTLVAEIPWADQT